MGKSLIIKGADFSINGFSEKLKNQLNHIEVIVGTTGNCAKDTLEIYKTPDRATIMVSKEYSLKDTPWTKTKGTNEWGKPIDEALIATHDMICLPNSVKKVTLNMTNTDYYYGLCVWGNKSGFLFDSGYKNNVPIQKDLSSYEDDFFWIVSTIKKGNSGSENIDKTLTKEKLGWNISIEYK